MESLSLGVDRQTIGYTHVEPTPAFAALRHPIRTIRVRRAESSGPAVPLPDLREDARPQIVIDLSTTVTGVQFAITADTLGAHLEFSASA